MALPERSENAKAKRRRRGARFSEPRATRRTRPITRNVETTTPTVTPSGSAPTTDEQFRAAYAEQGLQPLDRTTSTAEPPANTARAAAVTYPQAVPLPAAPARPSRQQQTRQKKKKPPTGPTGLARARATGINLGILSAGLFGWVFQAVFAILSIIFLAMAMAIQAFFDDSIQVASDGSILSTVGNFTFEIVRGVARTFFLAFDAISRELFGFSLYFFDPTNAFLITYTAVLGYAVLLLLIMYIIYKVNFLNPLSGQAAGFKKGMLLLAIVGYATPVLNLIPWFLFWWAAVWFKPK